MNAPALALVPLVEEPASLGVALSETWDPELERNILGAAMLSWPMPAWLEPRDFFPTQHQRIYEAVLSVGGNVAHVNAWLRDSSSKFGPPVAKSTELAEMCVEAQWALDMGWALDFEALRELRNRRELIESMQRVAIKLRAGELSHEEARGELREHFKEAKR